MFFEANGQSLVFTMCSVAKVAVDHSANSLTVKRSSVATLPTERSHCRVRQDA